MSRTADKITRLIEHIFCKYKKIALAVQEKKHDYGISTLAGAAVSAGSPRISDPTACQAIKNTAELETVVLDDGFRVILPERWLKIYNAVKQFCACDPIDREIFARRYDKCDKSMPPTIEQSVYSRHLLKIRNHAKMCAAQEQLIKVF